MNVAVESAGYLTTVQDLGRRGFRRDGVSLGGALDSHALTVANLLVGNQPDDAGLELTFGRTRLRFADDRVVAWCGGNFDVRGAGIKLPSGHAASLHSGEEVEVLAPRDGGRGWLAISGGIDVPVVLGSRATDLRSGFGGVDGRALQDGDSLRLVAPRARPASFAKRLQQSRISTWAAPNEWSSTTARHVFIRAVRGADWRRFGSAAAATLLNKPFTVQPESDRMGVRLAGEPIRRADATELLSEAVAPGTIQIPPDGQPIVLLGDCQTIGGYPKIAHVITVDLPAAAQLSPGNEVRFTEITLEAAHRLLLERTRDLMWFRAGLALKLG